MPEAGDGHGQEEVAVGAPAAAAVATQGDIEVVAQPAGQRQVPAPPEVLDAAGKIGPVEVFRKVEAQHQAQADGHGAVAGEVEEQLQRIGQAADPGVDEGRLVEVESHVHQRRQGVGHQHFHAQADHETARAEGEILAIEPALVEFATDPVVADDRPGDGVAEHGDVGGVVDEAALHRHHVAMDIYQVGNRLQHDEGQSGRQGHLLPVQWQGAGRHQHLTPGGDDDVGVFVPAEHRQVDHDQPGKQPQPRLRAFARVIHQQPADPGQQRQGHVQQQEQRAQPAVEQPAAHQQHPVAPAGPRQGVDQQEQRQEEGEEFQRGEDHRGAVLSGR